MISRTMYSVSPVTHPAQDIWVGDDDPEVDVDRRHEPALQLEVAKLDGLQCSTKVKMQNNSMGRGLHGKMI